jgi:MtN3 and saliva related transmembrane protein
MCWAAPEHVVAVAAPALNCVQLLPQLWKTARTRQVKGLSLLSLTLMVTTNLLWLIHGLYLRDASLIVSGVVCLTLNVALWGMVAAYR